MIGFMFGFCVGAFVFRFGPSLQIWWNNRAEEIEATLKK